MRNLLIGERAMKKLKRCMLVVVGIAFAAAFLNVAAAGEIPEFAKSGDVFSISTEISTNIVSAKISVLAAWPKSGFLATPWTTESALSRVGNTDTWEIDYVVPSQYLDALAGYAWVTATDGVYYVMVTTAIDANGVTLHPYDHIITIQLDNTAPYDTGSVKSGDTIKISKHMVREVDIYVIGPRWKSGYLGDGVTHAYPLSRVGDTDTWKILNYVVGSKYKGSDTGYAWVTATDGEYDIFVGRVFDALVTRSPYTYTGYGFKLDNTPPVVTITYPQAGDILPSATLPVEGTAIDAMSGCSSVDITINAGTLAVDKVTNTFEGIAISPNEPLDVTVTAEDKVGNESAATVTVIKVHDMGKRSKPE